MSMTLADVDAYRVYRDTEGDWVWKDRYGRVVGRNDRGDITAYPSSRPQYTIITGPCLGHVRDEPWRRSEAGSLADAHNRIDALQARVDALEHALKPKAGEDVPKSDRPPVPANPTQPPDVAVYELKYLDGRVRRYEYPSYDVNFNRPLDGACETRTVLDAFEGLGWDDLRRRWGLIPYIDPDSFLWRVAKIYVKDYASYTPIAGPFDTEKLCLTAARAIARKEGWR